MAYTSFKTRKALGKRYGTDPALLLEMERLNRQYQLAPGREARGMQAAQFASSQAQQAGQFTESLAQQTAARVQGASQFDESMAFNTEQARLNRAAQDEANKQAGKSSMVGTVGNLATTGMMMKYLSPKTVPPPTSVSTTGLKAGTPEFYSQTGATPPSTPTVTPATTDMSATGAGMSTATGTGAGVLNTGPAVGAGMEGMAGTTGATTGSVAGGIAGGVATAAPYYAAAKIGGGILTSVHDKEASTTTVPGYMNVLGKSLESPLNVERTWGQALGLEDDDSTTINILHDIINPLGYVERQAGTVICSELHRQGLMDDITFEADKKFGKKQDIETLNGYHSWAIPLANLMRKSKAITWIVKPIALAWAKDMAGGKNMFGKIINKIGIPICRFIGRKALEVAHG